MSTRLLFGEIAEDLGLASAEQVAVALRIQNEACAMADEAPLERGRRPPPPKLGEILVARHVLSIRDAQNVLVEQQRRRAAAGIAAPGAEASPSAGAPALRKIGPYEVLAVLGSGGMGVVYKARNAGTGRVVALKVLSLRLASDAEFVARFEREVQTASALSHPHIVGSEGAGSEHGRPYLAMEYVEGTTLGAQLDKSGRLPERRALEIAHAVAGALSYAHTQGVIHRDVKPDNVLLGADGSIKLTDFGLAKLLRDNIRLTQSGIAVGTAHYISPEQVAASRYIDHRADLYGLGAMLFHMVTGRVPFNGRNNNEVMLKHLNDRFPDPRLHAPDLSAGTAAIIAKLTAKKAAERYDTGSHAIEDLDLALRGRPPRYAPAVPRPRRLCGAGCGVVLAFFVLGVLCIACCAV